jgi:hypothetical protein
MIYRPFARLLVARSIHRRVNIYADRLSTPGMASPSHGP